MLFSLNEIIIKFGTKYALQKDNTLEALKRVMVLVWRRQAVLPGRFCMIARSFFPNGTIPSTWLRTRTEPLITRFVVVISFLSANLICQ